MNKQHAILFIVLIGVLLVGCTSNSPSVYTGYPKSYSTAYEQLYGHCYDSIEQAVVALDLYSNGLHLNEEKRIQGTGYNLYLSDIFVPDSMLEVGQYHSDTTAAAFTFLPGMDFEGTPHGGYILSIEDDLVTKIQVLDSGAFVYRNDSLLFTLYYKNSYGSKVTYRCSYHGELIPWVKK